MKIIKKTTLSIALFLMLFSVSVYANVKTNIITTNYGTLSTLTCEETRYEHTFSYKLEKFIFDNANYRGVKEINKTLSRYYDSFYNNEVKDGYNEFLKSTEEYIVDYDYIYKLDFSFEDKNIITLLQDSYVYTGGANGMHYIKPLMFSLNSGKEISSRTSTILKNKGDKALIELLRKKLLEAREKDLYFDFETITLPANFYVSSKGIVFSYGLYEIAPRVAGIIDITFTFEEIKPFVKNNPYLDYLFK